MAAKKKQTSGKYLPSTEVVQEELSSAKSIDDFFGRKGIFSRLFSKTSEQMMKEELASHLGYDKYEARGRNSGNSRNGACRKKLRTSGGDTQVEVPRDRNGSFSPMILKKHQRSSNEIEKKIIGMYARGVSVRDIQDTLGELYGINVSPATISTITNKVWEMVEDWQSRPLEEIYPIVYLDAIHLKVRLEGKVTNTATHIILGVDLRGRKDVLGHWVSDGAEGANYWLSVITDLQNRGVKDIFIACVDGLTGFKEAIQSVYPQAQIQRCIIHQIRNSLKYVSWKDRKKFTEQLKAVYKAPTKEEAKVQLGKLAEDWEKKYTIAVRSWEDNWDDLSTFFDYSQEIRRLIYTTNTIEGYNRQIRKVTKTKGVFPNPESVRKMLYLAHSHIAKRWTMPIQNWANILNQLAIKFEGRLKI
ncbi:IS256 family transposase [Patescibacteria group bacterium]